MQQMKVYPIFLFFLMISAAAKSFPMGNDSTRFYTLHFNRPALLRIEVIKNKGNHKIFSHYRSFIPDISKSTDTLVINSIGIRFLNFDIQKPVRVYLTIDEESNIPLFLVPDDTLIISVDLSKADVIKQSVTYLGKLTTINNYERQKSELLEDKLFMERAQLSAEKHSLSEIKNKLDSIKTVEWKYLDNFNDRIPLPAWFYKHEKAEINYFNASFKIGIVSYRKDLMKITEQVPTGYWDFLKTLPLNNEESVFSERFYYFFDSFSWLKYEKPEISKLNRDERLKVMIPLSLKLADSLLSGELRDIFKCWSISRNVIRNNVTDLADLLLKDQENRFQNSKYITVLKAYRNSKFNLAPGEKAPYFYLANEKGEFKAITDYKGKVVLLNFWATWCKPCRNEVVFEDELLKEFPVDKFVLINICLDSKENWLKAIDELNIKGINLFPQGNWLNGLTKKYFINGLPHYTLIDKDGNVYKNKTIKPSDGLRAEIAKLLEGRIH